ncbi:hypothetical protein C922_02275 [Plasmodium inui San Antonio 1]|uniref:Uncharacterized protein n=1 Tax=Plasmodium inui San Antonio 1 TaxID=1237626 RepID=W7A5T4_9APIC|nr:hypothetical protein C922_02275 [Plasmodium inui San Antonio 1]EUD67125.1 hypothetical protein C922_02275 [Plasmodium inui San Antonio 1]
MKSFPPVLEEMIKKGAYTTLSTVQGRDHTKSEEGKREGNDNYREDDSTNSVGCDGAYNSDSWEDGSTCASSIGKSVHIINASFSKIKKNLNDINKALNLDIHSEGETGDELDGQSEDGSDGATLSSDDSSVVRTFNASNGCSENDEDDNDEGDNRKRSKQLQLLLNNIINTKLEKKKIGTLDIIDECIAMKKNYNSSGEKKDEGGGEDNCAFVVDGVPRGVSYAQSIDLREVDNLDDLLAGVAASEAAHEAAHESTSETASDFAVHPEAPPGFDVVNLKDSGGVTSEDEEDAKAASETDSAEPPKGHPPAVMRFTDYLRNFKDSRKYTKGRLTYPIEFFLKKQQQFVQLLRRKKKLFYFVLHVCFLFSYLFFCLSFILCKRALYGMFYDQDL